MIAPARSDERVCRHCGAPIADALYTREHAGYCCESCFLATRRLRALPAEQNEAQFTLAEALARALDARERETGLHSKRVACHTLVLARRFTSDPEHLHQVYWGALLHDIGKIGIPDAILLKQGALNDDEWAVMRTHPEVGHGILASVPFLAQAAEIVLDHEERFDGTGYPRGLAGTAIPLWARLFAVVDTLDAISSDRPYRRALGFDAARAEIIAKSGTQFDPAAVEAFIAEEDTLRRMVEIKCETATVDAPGAEPPEPSSAPAGTRSP